MISSRTGIGEQILLELLKFKNNPQALSDKITECYNEYADFFAAFKEIKATKDRFSIEKWLRVILIHMKY